MKILVFGKIGQLATQLQRQADVIALGQDQADLTDPAACADIVASSDADVVINAAAWTAVDQAEKAEAEAHVVNANAPGAMARAAADKGIPFLHVSTDYVFDGSGTKPWQVGDRAAPLNAYGRTKLAGECAVRAAGGAHVILRTAGVFAAHGENFVRAMLRLADSRDALTVVDDQIGGPTPAADVASVLLTIAGAMVDGQAGGTYHFCGAPAVSKADFARAIFAAAGREVRVTDIATAKYPPTPAQRPLNSRLDCSGLRADFGIEPADWQAGLAGVLKELRQGI